MVRNVPSPLCSRPKQVSSRSHVTKRGLSFCRRCLLRALVRSAWIGLFAATLFIGTPCLAAAQLPSAGPSKQASRESPGSTSPRRKPAQAQPQAPQPATGKAVRLPLTKPVTMDISVQPVFAGVQNLKLMCLTNVYRGESSVRDHQASFQLGISGRIEKVAQDRFLVSYDLEVRYRDNMGTTSFSAAGSGLLVEGKPTTLLVVGGKSVVMTVTTGETENSGK